MKTVVKYDDTVIPPVLRLYIHGCPHKRQHREVLQKHREELYLQVRHAYLHNRFPAKLPINHPIDLEILFTNPNTPDLDHLLEAVFMMLDGKSLKGPSLLTDDRLIQSVKMSKYYPNAPTKRDGAR